jgi:hypothetical protein
LIGGGGAFFLPTAVTVVVTDSAARNAGDTKAATVSATPKTIAMPFLRIVFLMNSNLLCPA